MACLYQLTFPNDKRYIGITTHTAEVRARGHRTLARSGGKTAVSAAIRLYGDFKVETLVVAEIDYLRDLEIKVIAAFGTLAPDGYNLGLGGEIAPTLNPDVAAKHKGNKHASREGKPKIIRSEAYIKKLSASLKGNKNSLGNDHGIGNNNASGKRNAEQVQRIKDGVAAAKARRANSESTS